MESETILTPPSTGFSGSKFLKVVKLGDRYAI